MSDWEEEDQRVAFECYTQFAYTKGMQRAPMTVVETERFLRDAQPLMPESERSELVAFVAANPEAGDVISQAGGACQSAGCLR